MLPRAWCVNEVVIAPNASQALADFVQTAFDPGKEASVEGRPSDLEALRGVGPLVNGCKMTRFAEVSANRIAINVHTTNPTFLVVSENWYPGWTATVNGQTRTILRVDSTLMGMWLGAGDSEIRLVFRPRYVWFGISSAFLATALLLFTRLTWYSQAEAR